MTIEEVIQTVEDQAGQRVTLETQLSELGLDSLEFLDLLVQIGIPDTMAPSLHTVKDIFRGGTVIRFQVETWADSVQEMREIWPEHYASLALNQNEIKLACDEAKYEQGEASGNLIVITAREDGAMVGYYYGMLLTHLHYKDAGLMCYTDVYWLKPEHRKGGAGAKFMIAVQQILKFRGVVKLYMSTKVHQDNGALFERLGMKLSDRVFTKLL